MAINKNQNISDLRVFWWRYQYPKGGFPLVRLATGTGTRTGKWSREHAQFDNFSFPRKSFPVRLVSEKVESSSTSEIHLKSYMTVKKN